MIPRYVTRDLESAHKRSLAVLLVGPHEVGETILAFDVSNWNDSLYLDLEDINDRVKLSDPTSFLENHEDKLVVLDEIYRTQVLAEDDFVIEFSDRTIWVIDTKRSKSSRPRSATMLPATI